MDIILKDNKRVAGTVFAELDSNFLAICNFLIKIGNADLNLKYYAKPTSSEPSAPAENDCYLVIEAGTIWEKTVEEYNIITWRGDEWVVESFKLTELRNVIFGTDSASGSTGGGV